MGLPQPSLKAHRYALAKFMNLAATFSLLVRRKFCYIWSEANQLRAVRATSTSLPEQYGYIESTSIGN